MQMLELSKYLGVGYESLAKSPRWFLEMALIRLREEGSYNQHLLKKGK